LHEPQPNFVIGLSQRANHPPSQLHLLHGNLFDIKCFGTQCNYFEPNNLKDPIVPALAVTDIEPKPSENDKTGEEATSSLYNAMGMKPKSTVQGRINLLDPYIKDETIPRSQLPHCPECTTNLLRPGVVWFGEALPETTIYTIENWIYESEKIDMMLVIGTTAEVYPAARYIERARQKGARIAVINMDSENLGATGSLREEDWMFEGDAGAIVPEIFRTVIGDLKIEDEKKDA
jgi:NAD+-dependent protein deacetylase sirtuin 5